MHRLGGIYKIILNTRAQRVQNLAYALIQAGIKPQDRVAVLAPNWFVHITWRRNIYLTRHKPFNSRFCLIMTYILCTYNSYRRPPWNLGCAWHHCLHQVRVSALCYMLSDSLKHTIIEIGCRVHHSAFWSEAHFGRRRISVFGRRCQRANHNISRHWSFGRSI